MRWTGALLRHRRGSSGGSTWSSISWRSGPTCPTQSPQRSTRKSGSRDSAYRSAIYGASICLLVGGFLVARAVRFILREEILSRVRLSRGVRGDRLDFRLLRLAVLVSTDVAGGGRRATR